MTDGKQGFHRGPGRDTPPPDILSAQLFPTFAQTALRSLDEGFFFPEVLGWLLLLV